MLTWLALRYTKHDDLKNINAHLKIYDEVDPRQSESIATGGRAKGDNFCSEVFPTFPSDPLNRLLTEVRATFAFRYQFKKYSPDEIQKAIDFMASRTPVDPSIAHHLGAYFYGSGLESLKKPNWLIEVFNKHLESHDWPLYDKAVANDLTSSTGSAPKRTSTQAALEDRALGSNSKRRH